MTSAADKETALASRYAPSTMAQLHAARGAALHQYVHLEDVSQVAFSYAVGAREPGRIDHKKEMIVLHVFGHVLRNSHYHRKLMKEIGKSYLSEEKQEFVRTLLKEFGELSEKRNVIAHAQILPIRGYDGKMRHCLRSRGTQIDESAMFVEDLNDFVKRARFAFHGMNIFRSAVMGVVPDWIEAADYNAALIASFEVPPPEGSPLHKFWK
ncbi:MAG: hypothetical protein AAFN79_17090 [Pseudomonadota bacterium]